MIIENKLDFVMVFYKQIRLINDEINTAFGWSVTAVLIMHLYDLMNNAYWISIDIYYMHPMAHILSKFCNLTAWI